MSGPSREERIRQMAHVLWENAGRPEGHGEAHWLEAERIVTEQMTAAAHPPEAVHVINAPDHQAEKPAPMTPAKKAPAKKAAAAKKSAGTKPAATKKAAAKKTPAKKDESKTKTKDAAKTSPKSGAKTSAKTGAKKAAAKGKSAKPDA